MKTTKSPLLFRPGPFDLTYIREEFREHPLFSAARFPTACLSRFASSQGSSFLRIRSSFFGPIRSPIRPKELIALG